MSDSGAGTLGVGSGMSRKPWRLIAFLGVMILLSVRVGLPIGRVETAAAASVQPVISPLGDSITHADSSHQSYRYPLWIKLVDAGIVFDFVGSQSTNSGGDPIWPDHAGQTFDPDHEGHAGWRADEIRDGLPTWLVGYTPDIVLLHIGTNDAFQNQSTSTTVDEIKQIIDALRVDNPNVVVLLAKLIPSTDTSINQGIDALNAEVDGIAVQMDTAESPVVVVDQNTGFSAAVDTYDGVHPNVVGEEKMAQKWYDAIVQALDGTPPTAPAAS